MRLKEVSMFQNIEPHVYNNEFKEINSEGYALYFSGNSVCTCITDDDSVVIPTTEQFGGADALEKTFLFTIDDVPYYWITEKPDLDKGGFTYTQLDTIRGRKPKQNIFAIATANSLRSWYLGNKYCSSCRTPMKRSGYERALVCPECGRTIYPTISPAIIVGIIDGDYILVTRYKDRPYKNLALVAGFNEIGESIEDTVRREVHEETGLTVDKILFYKSQPWPQTNSLLMGFFATVKSPDGIVVQESELSEAYWLRREDLPEDNGFSLTGEIMQQFKEHNEPIF